ncbi:hypothetical protein [Clostridium sp. AM58-1XD]|uniref:hypothetical protein n=1 Tax=Clostridium sp. AM58-1XD TaxID=2292307 RepID=UPI0015F41A9F|nr:hypothetical protein [Clostridium sp. AM58-1XD]
MADTGGNSVVLIAAVGIGGLIIGAFSGSGSKKANREKLAYIKDDGLYYTNLKKLKKDPVEFTDELAEDSRDYSFSGIMIPTNVLEFSKDGKYCYYPDRIDSGGAFRLMKKKIGSKKDSEKIDSDVKSFKVEESGMVIYQKKNDALYAWDGKEKIKLDSDVAYYKVAKEGGAVIWEIQDGEEYKLYYQKPGKKGEKKKLESGVSEILDTNDDFSRIIILKNDAVYLIEKQGEKVKLAGDILDVKGMNADDLTFYYTAEADQIMTAADYVADDVGQDTYDSYRYDSLRKDLREREIQDGTKELYYFNGKEKQLISNRVKQINFSGQGVMIYGQPEEEDIPKLRLSEIYTAGDVESYVREAQDDLELYLIAGGESKALNADSLQRFKNDKDNKLIYALEGLNDEEERDLVTINYGKGKFGEIKTIDEDVENLEDLFNGSIYYYKDLTAMGIREIYTAMGKW